ncbi:MAG: GGDEF domain-containing protein [Oscillospiraceae bacterium]|nr:GGDEF domain-containing protein [Oscillospiraceae bacterium]
MGDNLYLYMLDELDKSMYREQDMTNKKVDTIQNMYLFSMYIDIVKDTTNSISVTEISDEVLNQQIKYSEWRMMIVNMISKEFQAQFLEETDPETLKRKYAPGQTSSFDCLMMNLEGVYIWVKLIFSRAETSNDDDFRFVFMVQNIHETAVELHQTLKEYELRASLDTLTSVYNHGRIETEIVNAIAEKEKTEHSISMMILDIDFFKQINDTYGHSAGDVALVDFTKKINGCIGDTNAVFGRWGGEEFVMVCYDAPLEKALEIAEKLRAQVESSEFEKIGKMTCSIGVTEITADDKFDTAFDRMDKALYHAKSEGRNCVRYEA